MVNGGGGGGVGRGSEKAVAVSARWKVSLGDGQPGTQSEMGNRLDCRGGFSKGRVNLGGAVGPKGAVVKTQPRAAGPRGRTDPGDGVSGPVWE